MMPQGTPAKSCSAFWQSKAFSIGSSTLPYNASIRVAAATSNAALLASPPPGLGDGEYWARLVISAKGGQLPVTGAADTARVKVGLTLEVRTIIGVFYRKGAVHTGVTLSGLRTAVVGDSLAVWARLAQQGNAAYIGSAHAVLVDSAGKTVSEIKVPIGVYYAMEPRYALPIGALAPGRYRLRLDLSTGREDLAPELVLPSPPVRDSAEVRVP